MHNTLIVIDAMGNEWVTTITEMPVFEIDPDYNYEYIEYDEDYLGDF